MENYISSAVHERTCWGGDIYEYSHLIIVRWKLVEELLDSELLSRTAHVGNLILGQAGEI